MNKELRGYKRQLKELLKEHGVKVKDLFYLDDNRGYMALLKYRDVNLLKLNFLKGDINKIFSVKDCKFSVIGKDLILTIYKPREFLKYEPVELNEFELLLGYYEDGYIIADMRKQAHVLISGLCGQGKSKMVSYLLRNIGNKADILVLNGFKEDYKGFTLIRDLKSIERRIEAINSMRVKRDKPLFIVLEEMQVISKNKKLQENLKELLSVGRHYNVFVIGIIQIASKENCSFKDLFNSRVSFKQVDSSSYSVCLGVNVDKSLEQREFYFLGDDLRKGYTFNV